MSRSTNRKEAEDNSGRKSSTESASSSSPDSVRVSNSRVKPTVEPKKQGPKSPNRSTSVSLSKSTRASKGPVQRTVKPTKQAPVADVIQKIGLFREQLQPYEKSDFWLTFRYTSLVAFWISWFVLVIAVIVIVLLSTKCPPKPDLRWWQHATFYELWLPSFKDSNGDGAGDLAGVREKLRYLSKNVKPTALYVRPSILLSSLCCEGFWVKDFHEIEHEMGTLVDFDNLVKTAHSREIRIVIDFPVTIVSVDHEWYHRSVDQEPEFKNFFYRVKRKKSNQTKALRIRFSGNAGVILNWSQKSVRRAVLDAAKFWIDRNIDGIHLSLVEYMDVNSTTRKPTGDLDKIGRYLKKFIVQLKDHAKDRDLFVFTSLNRTLVKNLTAEEFEEKLTPELSGFDAILSDRLFYFDQTCKMTCLREELEMWVGTQIDTYRWYTLGGPNVGRLADTVGVEMVQMFNLLFLTLPGSVTIYYGDEIGMIDDTRQLTKYDLNETYLCTAPMPWTNEDSKIDSEVAGSSDDHVTTNVEAQLGLSHGHLSMVRRLVTVRQSEYAINYGDFDLGAMDENLLLVNISSPLSSTHLIVLLHFGDQKIYDLTDSKFGLNLARCHVTLVAGTENLFRRGALVDRQRVDLTKIELLKNEALVVRVKKF